jgi:acid phosphatase
MADQEPGRWGRRAVALSVAALLVALAAGSPGSAPTGAAPGSGDPARPAAAPLSRVQAVASTSRVARRPSKLLVVVLENRAASRVARRMPYLSAQGRRYGVATRYYGVTHPSLPNYLSMVGGSTFRVRDDGRPAAHRLRGRSVFGQALAHHRTAATYAEGMRVRCQQRNTGRYAVRHNPWAYFRSERAACRRYDVPAGTPARGNLHRAVAAGRLPTFALLVPDVCNDAHDCSLARADRWLRSWLRRVEAGPDWRSGRLAVLVTFDEDDHSARNHVAAVLLHPSLHAARVHRRLDHHDLSAGISRLVGGAPMRGAAHRRGLLAAFGLA